MIIDDFYPNRIRIYTKYCPALRAGREGLKTVERKKNDNAARKYNVKARKKGKSKSR